MNENYPLITHGFRQLLTGVAPYICKELMTEYGAQWWQVAVLGKLYPEQQRNLPQGGDNETLVNSLDIYLCLLLLDLYWGDIFRKKLAIDNRTWAKELIGVRNRLAHIGSDDFSDNDTWRALDTMARLCDSIDASKAEEIRSLLRESRYGSPQGSTAGAASLKSSSENSPSIPNLSGLPCWREIIQPHPDVAEGRYKNAEFAADLAQVARGEGSLEYLDPVEFFNRTYVTDGMQGLLVEAIQRVANKGGEPVIQLKTAFGGGKTHSMLALYHLLRGKAPLAKIPAIKPILEKAGLSALPQTHVAVLVGTALDPSKSRRPPTMPGITVNTLWGELACQLAISTGKPKLYDLVKEADKKGISPGSETLARLFDLAGSCLVLMDELVAYGRKIYGQTGLPAGNFENFISFIQELTEAARASKSSLVAASIPESNIEIGGDAGQKVLEVIEHTFGRMESIWKPVAANEGFEVVRRRLFLDCKNPQARDMICKAFSDMYNDNPTDFPVEAREVDYSERMAACYPIHPEVFDRLYEDWATLEHFQRTRGVLRLMAAVIHELWMNNDQSLLIQPGTLPLDAPAVRDELIRRLKENWNAIADREVDGKNSVPFQLDKGNLRYGKYQASRRVARAIMLGSAPTVKQQRVRGLEASRIRLGVVQPGEQVAVFNDALGALQNSLSFLYSNQSGDRFWYDTRPTLRKTMEDRATQITASDVEYEIEQRLKKQCKKVAPITGVHVCPASSLDVPDEQSARLVALSPKDIWTGQNDACPALKAAMNILDQKGNSPRQFKNMLVFLAPDKAGFASLEEEVRRYLAWNSIKKDSEDLNLDAAQNRETENSLKRSSEIVDMRLHDTWCWLLVPAMDKTDMKNIQWEVSRLSGKGDAIITRAAKKLEQDEQIIEKWAPALLLMELDNLLWKDVRYLEVKKLWEYLSTYCYLPRLADYGVLETAIQKGIASDQYFGYAAAIGENRCIDLKFNQPAQIEKSGYLVKREAAIEQLEAEVTERARIKASQETHKDGENTGPVSPSTGVNETNNTPYGGTDNTQTIGKPETQKLTRFFLNAKLDNTRINRDVDKIMAEVLNHIAQDGTLEIRLEVQAASPNGFQQQTVRTATENCRTLKIDDFGFDEE